MYRNLTNIPKYLIRTILNCCVCNNYYYSYSNCYDKSNIIPIKRSVFLLLSIVIFVVICVLNIKNVQQNYVASDSSFWPSSPELQAPQETIINNTSQSAVLLSVRGGIGNQLFQYACSYTLAKKYGWSLYIHVQPPTNKNLTTPLQNGREFSLHHFRIPLNTQNTVDDDWISKRKEDIVQLRDDQLLDYDVPNHPNSHRILQLSPKDYCQSEVFFSPYRSEIMAQFQLDHRNDPPSKWIDLITSAGHNSVAVHIRRGDFVRLGNAVPISFYIQGLNSFSNNSSHPVSFFIFSDEIIRPEVKSRLEKAALSNFQTIHYVERLHPLQDFQLITACSHALIGTSTFAWWAAYLIRNKDKVIIAAGYNLRDIWSTYFRWQYKFLYYPVGWRKMQVKYV